MARSTLSNTKDDLISDSGAVLWSFVKGEQLEYPVSLNFLDSVYAGYDFEAVVIEADNFEGQTSAPISSKVGGVQTTLTVRIPSLRGDWLSTQAYVRDEVVRYGGKLYALLQGVGVIDATPPDSSPLWAETTANTLFIQFPASLASTWSVPATANSAVYGFFELRVTETSDVPFKHTWKPIRGMVQILFSPTDAVPDV